MSLTPDQADEVSVAAFAGTILRWRRTIYTLTIIGGFIGIVAGLLSPRVYESSATFIPQASSSSLAGAAGLASAASQFGLQLPFARGADAWTPLVYVELLLSRDLLEPLALDTVSIAEEGGRKARLIDLLENVPADLPPAARSERAVRVLRAKIVDASENKRVGGVDVTVTSKWASVSFTLAQRLVDDVNRFNLVMRKSQAAEERRFVEGQAAEAERALRAAEDQVQSFEQSNRVTTSPSLKFEQDRLQRQLSLRQSVYTSLVQSREDARIREVRDTPVITVLKSPVLAASSKSRRVGLKGLIGGVVGGLLAVLFAFLSEGLAASRASARKETQELWALLDDATPRFLRRRVDHV